MKKHIKQIISLLLCAVLLAGTCSICAFATDKKVSDTFKFNDDGKFTILNFSDFHFGQKMKSLITKDFIRATVKSVQPDLIILSGDNMTGKEDAPTEKKVKAGIDDFMDIFEKIGIPVAWVFGNHDSQVVPMDRQDQFDYYDTFSCSIAKAKDEWYDGEMYGVGNYNIPIYASNSDKVKFNLWFFDSGENNDAGNEQGVHTSQLKWYTEKEKYLEELGGGKVPSLIFQHIVVPEIYDALVQSDEYTDDSIVFGDKYFRLPDNASGYMYEKPCPNSINYGQFDTVVKTGDCLAICTGHDHTNAFDIPYKGVRLINTPQARMNLFGDIASRGARVFVLNENEPENFDTYVLHMPDTLKSNPIDMLVYHVVNFIYKAQRFFETLFNKQHKLG